MIEETSPYTFPIRGRGGDGPVDMGTAEGGSDDGSVHPEGVHDELTELFIGEDDDLGLGVDLDADLPVDLPASLEDGMGVDETRRGNRRVGGPVPHSELEALPVDGRDSGVVRRIGAGTDAFEHEASEIVPDCVSEAVIVSDGGQSAAIWVRQYAGAAARGDGRPVALVRLAPEGVSVETFGASDLFEPALTVSEAMRAVRHSCGRVIFRVDEVEQPRLLDAGWIDEMTVVTPEDDASTVAAYRLLKLAASTYDRSLGEGEGPGLGVAIMGADDADGDEAWRRLDGAAQRFLGRPIQRRIGAGRVTPQQTTLLARAEGRYRFDEIGEAWLEAAFAEPVASGAETLGDELRDWDGFENQTVSQTGGHSRGERDGTATIGDEAPVVGHGEATESMGVTAVIAALGGLRELDVPCPVLADAGGEMTGRVGIAIGEDGGLRVVGVLRDVAEEPADAERVVEVAGAVACWAGRHAALLKMIEPRLDAAAPTKTHLVGESFAAVRGMLGTGRRLHLAVRANGALVTTPIE